MTVLFDQNYKMLSEGEVFAFAETSFPDTDGYVSDTGGYASDLSGYVSDLSGYVSDTDRCDSFRDFLKACQSGNCSKNIRFKCKYMLIFNQGNTIA